MGNDWMLQMIQSHDTDPLLHHDVLRRHMWETGYVQAGYLEDPYLIINENSVNKNTHTKKTLFKSMLSWSMSARHFIISGRNITSRKEHEVLIYVNKAGAALRSYIWKSVSGCAALLQQT